MDTKKKFFRKKLKNGISVFLEKRDLPVVSVSITNRFGGAFEDSGEKGVAHFIEHLLFTGTKNRTHEDISREIEKRGGILNAFTSHEVTSYWFKLPSEHLFLGLDVLTDMLKNPKFDEEKFEKEKKVILEEIKLYHDDPAKDVFNLIEKNLYEKPFGELIIGSKETVSNLKRDNVVDYFEKHYSPENYFVVVVGDANFEEVCEYFEENFELGNKNFEIKKIVKKNGDIVEERAGVDQANFVFATHAPLMKEKGYAALEILNAYLASGMSSKLFLEIREKRGLAYTVRGSIEAEKNYSFYNIYVGTTKEAVDEVKKIILEEFDKIEKEMTEENLEEAKERLIGLKKVRSEESMSVMQELIFEELNDNIKGHYEFEDKIRGVKLEDVKKLAKELIEQGYSTAAIVPK
jgi:predicted Zn-dependent peptidase